MTSVGPVTQTSSSSATDPGSQTAQTAMQQAFADGIVKFMGIMLQGAESDIISAINDNTSTPDAPG